MYIVVQFLNCCIDIIKIYKQNLRLEEIKKLARHDANFLITYVGRPRPYHPDPKSNPNRTVDPVTQIIPVITI